MLSSREVPSALVAALVTLGLGVSNASVAHHEQDIISTHSAGTRGGPPSATRPAAAGPVSVTVGLSLTDVHFDLKINSDERRRVTDQAVVTGWMATEWTDASLAWSDDAAPVGPASRSLRLDEDIWIPDIRHLNTIGSLGWNLLQTSSSADAVVDSTGRVRVQSLVQLLVRFLPREGFDSFVIRLGSRVMTTAEMDLLPASDAADMAEYTGWYVNDTWMRRNETSRDGFAEPFSVIEVGIKPAVI